MELSSITHIPNNQYAYSIGEDVILIHIKVKRGDVKEIYLHHQEKYVPISKLDTRRCVRMNLFSKDDLHDYYQIEVSCPHYVCLRYYFEIKFNDGNVRYYGNYRFYNYQLYDVSMMWDCPINVRNEEIFKTPDWAKNKVLYQIFPYRFHYKKPLQGIREKLDYFKELGIDILYLTPIFLSPKDHKYEIVDYYKIDPSFGDENDLKELVKAAHMKGMYIVLDAVFNHTSQDFFAFKDIKINKENSRYLDWYYIESFPLRYNYGTRPSFKTFSYYGGMPKVNLSNKEAAEYFLNVAKYYIRVFDIDGWRLDVGDEVIHDFWRIFRKEIKAIKPEALIIGEVWHHEEDYLRGDEWDTVMNYHFYDSIMSFFFQNNKPSDLVNNLGFMLANVHQETFPLLLNLFDSHDTNRLYHILNYDKNKYKAAVALELLLPGIPFIYYGDEIGLRQIRQGDSRMDMIWDENIIDKDIQNFYKYCLFVRKSNPDFIIKDIHQIYANDENNTINIISINNDRELKINLSNGNISIINR